MTYSAAFPGQHASVPVVPRCGGVSAVGAVCGAGADGPAHQPHPHHHGLSLRLITLPVCYDDHCVLALR